MLWGQFVVRTSNAKKYPVALNPNLYIITYTKIETQLTLIKMHMSPPPEGDIETKWS